MSLILDLILEAWSKSGVSGERDQKKIANLPKFAAKEYLKKRNKAWYIGATNSKKIPEIDTKPFVKKFIPGKVTPRHAGTLRSAKDRVKAILKDKKLDRYSNLSDTLKAKNRYTSDSFGRMKGKIEKLTDKAVTDKNRMRTNRVNIQPVINTDMKTRGVRRVNPRKNNMPDWAAQDQDVIHNLKTKTALYRNEYEDKGKPSLATTDPEALKKFPDVKKKFADKQKRSRVAHYLKSLRNKYKNNQIVRNKFLGRK